MMSMRKLMRMVICLFLGISMSLSVIGGGMSAAQAGTNPAEDPKEVNLAIMFTTV